MKSIKPLIIMDAAVLSEIAKHLSLKCKFICKLLSKRLIQYVRIFKLNELHYALLNDDRLDSLPDLREFIYNNSTFQLSPDGDKLVRKYDAAKLAKYKLITFKYCDCGFDVDFSFLNNMKTLKYLDITIRNDTSFNWPLIDITNILKTLNLEYYTDDYDYGSRFVSYKDDSFNHMKLKAFNYEDSHNHNQKLFCDTLKYVSISDQSDIDKIIKLNMSIHTLKLLDQEHNTCDLMLLKNLKLHKLIICIRWDYPPDFRFIKNMKLFELQIHQQGMRSCYLPEIALIKSSCVKRLIIRGGIHYTTDELNQLDSDVYVDQHQCKYGSHQFCK